MLIAKKATAKSGAKKAAAKPAAKKAAAKPAAKKAAAKPAAKAVAARPANKVAPRAARFVATGERKHANASIITGVNDDPGFETVGKIVVPINIKEGTKKSDVVVDPDKLSKALLNSHEKIKNALKSFASAFSQDFGVSEIEISVSFNAKGEFMGFGLGGALTAKIKMRPVDAES